MNDAMAQVKKELGRDAVVLHTKRIRDGGFMGFFGKEMVEVLAAVDSSPAPVNPAPVAAPSPTPPKKAAPPPEEKAEPSLSEEIKETPAVAAEQRAMPAAVKEKEAVAAYTQRKEDVPAASASQERPVRKSVPTMQQAKRNTAVFREKAEQPKPQLQNPAALKTDAEVFAGGIEEPRFTSLKSEISSMKKMMEQLMEANLNPEKFDYFQNASPLLKLLLKNEVEPTVAAELVKGIPSEQAAKGIESETVKQVIIERIAQYLKNIEGINVSYNSCKKVALIGPTGVGKTTTIAKLAANFTIKQGYKVALITADTYRIAAIEQLRIYADIIGIPLEIVYSPEELKKAFARHSDKHLILVDNAGRSPSNSDQLAELKALLEVDPEIETHLVLSATIRYREALEAVKRFAVCSPDKILFTKIDESCTLGTLLNILHYFPSTLSYLTTGQSVPEDIELADANKLAAMMLKDF
jgi:flagellar biosynthesis protein FlhF